MGIVSGTGLKRGAHPKSARRLKNPGVGRRTLTHGNDDLRHKNCQIVNMTSAGPLALGGGTGRGRAPPDRRILGQPQRQDRPIVLTRGKRGLPLPKRQLAIV